MMNGATSAHKLFVKSARDGHAACQRLTHTKWCNRGTFRCDGCAYAEHLPHTTGDFMNKSKTIIKGSLLLGLIMFASACVVAPNEGYYDRDHHRYYHEHNWHECDEHDRHCG
jgi:hypothetical protein